jgi:hypothetical protein
MSRVKKYEDEIKEFLEQIESDGRSSPAGQHWAEFYKLLCRYVRGAGSSMPPVPLILAAASESDSAKHLRLAEQLKWAKANSALIEALRFLKNLQPDDWNHGTVENWHRSFY